mmetsp:Transcript_39213/g.98837  ORF Transcript_39213/g.98837 Transcript_39213/m.98837 type:complete len:341 (+) Transcript_39213:195-1217(+)
MGIDLLCDHGCLSGEYLTQRLDTFGTKQTNFLRLLPIVDEDLTHLTQGVLNLHLAQLPDDLQTVGHHLFHVSLIGTACLFQTFMSFLQTNCSFNHGDTNGDLMALALYTSQSTANTKESTIHTCCFLDIHIAQQLEQLDTSRRFHKVDSFLFTPFKEFSFRTTGEETDTSFHENGKFRDHTCLLRLQEFSSLLIVWLESHHIKQHEFTKVALKFSVSEQMTEQFLWIHLSTSFLSLNSSLSAFIIGLTAMIVREHLISTADFFELLFCNRIVWVLVRVVETCFKEVGFFDLRRGCIRSNAKHIIESGLHWFSSWNVFTLTLGTVAAFLGGWFFLGGITRV